ncbi:MAG TPA: primosomal protein N' [Gemmatimonadaceae bacterium]|nr:primosomal protein N' [Gemmatimonadaceae bacterium]
MSAPPPAGRLVEVALPLPLFRTFTYVVEREPRHSVVPGARVVVPLRGGKEIGICVGDVAEYTGKAAPKTIIDVPDAEPAISATMLELARWIAEYYVVPIGQVLRSMLPVLLSGAGDPTPSHRTRRVAVLREELPSLLHRDKLFARAPKQRVLFELLESLGGRSPVEHLIERLDCSPSVLRKLVTRGLVAVEEEIVRRDPFASRVRQAPLAVVPTQAQRSAVAALSGGRPGEVFLLHGITGSGKTLVYIELLREVVERRGRSAIVLVPEIALTPQTVDRFRAVFGDRIAVLHSALGDGERYDEWLALQRGEKRIAVGARSAIFAPLADVGAIIVDEEHESTYKQGESPRYHAREVAMVRARAEGAVVVLGSATPSLESWTNAAEGKYRLLTLPDRVGGGRLPEVEVVDLRETRKPSPPSDGTPADPFRWVVSEPLESSLTDRLRKEEQSILLLNRRGYASFVQCRSCGNVAACPNCSISLTYHRAPERLVCHYCLHHEVASERCDRCSGVTMRQRGLGTQQVERLLAERFPSARIARMDVDTTSGKWAHTEILDRVARREVDILLGTQMIAKGLDFPNVTLVGVVDADTGINLPDFRASERCFQLLAQVAGRAGRGPKGGRVLIQTRLPGHHAVRCAVEHDFETFVRQELAGRREPVYPPFNRLANIVFSGTSEEATSQLALDAGGWLTRLLARAGGGLTMIGPAPCPVERVKRRWRWHVLLKADHSRELTRVAHYFMRRFEVPKRSELRVTLDRDPVALL